MSHTPPHLSDPQLQTVTDDTFDGFVRSVASGFQEVYNEDWSALAEEIMDKDRFWGHVVDGRFVSTYGAYTRQISVPGGQLLPVAAVTEVTVQPPYRRRGLLRQMMQRGLEDFAERGEPLAALWASEATIYGRFGFGPATSRLVLSGSRARMRFLDTAPVSGSVDEVDRDHYLDIGRAVWPHVQQDRPGALNRADEHWKVATFDAEYNRRGTAGPRFVAHFDDAGTADGFAMYRFAEGDDSGQPAGEVRISEVHAASPAAYAGLWRYLLDLDLSARFTFRNAPVDEPLRYLLADARALSTTLTDNIYVRVIDVQAALAARQYAADIDLVLKIEDRQLPANSGRYRLTATAWGDAQVSRTADAADLSLDALELGAAYLGGVSVESLAYAGRVAEHTDGALRHASQAFGWPVAPHCADHF